MWLIKSIILSCYNKNYNYKIFPINYIYSFTFYTYFIFNLIYCVYVCVARAHTYTFIIIKLYQDFLLKELQQAKEVKELFEKFAECN